eukprot:498988-Amphidinium_carterae.1
MQLHTSRRDVVVFRKLHLATFLVPMRAFEEDVFQTEPFGGFGVSENSRVSEFGLASNEYNCNRR